MLLTNPLGGERRAHSSNFRFARVDTFVRDIRQVIDDAIERARPTDGKVALVGYSAGGLHVGRTLYAANPVLPGSADFIAKVSRVVFLSSFYGLGGVAVPTEETPPPTGFATFPLTLTNASGFAGTWNMPPAREAACTGHVIPGTPDQLSTQIMEQETVGREWGGSDRAHPTGLSRSPVFSSYGWNNAVAGQLTTPTLVIHGLEDTGRCTVYELVRHLCLAPGIDDEQGARTGAVWQPRPAERRLLWSALHAALGETLWRDPRRSLGWPPCHVQGGANRVDQERDLQRRRERAVHRRRQRRGERQPMSGSGR
jgi:pimeloyl-ACP methyl ester carboxylesterase